MEICDNSLDDDGDTLVDCDDTADCCSEAVCAGDPACVGCIDADGDTYDLFDAVECPTGDDCDDTDAAVNPGASEDCYDGIDNDCDFAVDCSDSDCFSDPGCCEDKDSDGYGVGDLSACPESGEDCDDSDPFTYPGAIEICDEKDNDCDGEIDEGCVSGKTSILSVVAPDTSAGTATSIGVSLRLAREDEKEVTLKVYYEDSIAPDYEGSSLQGETGSYAFTPGKEGTYKVVVTIPAECDVCTRTSYFSVVRGELDTVAIPGISPLLAVLCAVVVVFVVGKRD